MKIALMFLLITFLQSCVKNEKDPEVALKKYINDWFSGSLSKEEALLRTTGILYHKVSAMDDAQFKEFSVKDGHHKRDLIINLKTCTEKSCHITYTIEYDQNSPEYKANIAVKKIAELVWESDSWKIADVNNVKTFLEFKNEVIP